MGIETWNKGKVTHLALAEAAAEKYDETYEAANFATGAYMQYELDTLKKAISLAPARTIALDLGCGTGRASFVLTQHFEQVFAFDFAPSMIREATAKKHSTQRGNVQFELRDVEETILPYPNESVAFVNTGFGMGSFVYDLPKLVRDIRRVLQPGGIAIFSFYNSAALAANLPLDWRPALAASIVPNSEQVLVNFGGKDFSIPARAYSLASVKKILGGMFAVHELTTFPTLSSLFPQTLFGDERVRTLCATVDHLLATDEKLAGGPYIVAVCKKSGPPLKEDTILGYEKVLEALRMHRVPLDVREHEPAHDTNQVAHLLGASLETIVKSILVAVDAHPAPENEKQQTWRHANLYLVGIPASRNIHFGKLAQVLGQKREQVRLATQAEFEDRTGFTSGSIPPFGLTQDISVILDMRLLVQPSLWCETGKTTESLHLSLDQLKRLSMASFFDVSR